MADTPRTVNMYVDESGTTADSRFLVGMFCTVADARWRERIQTALDDERYGNTLHFKEISSNPRNGRYRVSQRLVQSLSDNTDWWGHFSYIDRSLVDASYFSHSVDIEYNKWLADLIRWRTRRAGYRYEVLIAHRDRLRADDFIPERLQFELNRRSQFEGLPEVALKAALARTDRMLQMADLLVSGIRQRYIPSGNPLKREIGEKVDALVRWPEGTGNRRIFPFEWRPRSML